jgi:hypothetical protein
VKHVKQFINENHKIDLNYEQVRNLLLSIGATFGIVQLNPTAIQPRNYHNIILDFINKYDKALKLEKENKALIFYLDESSFYTNMSSNRSWQFRDSNNNFNTNLINRDFNVGKHLKLIHCISREGLVGQSTFGMEKINFFKEQFSNIFCYKNSAELILVPKTSNINLQVAIDSDLFLIYIEKVLIPSCEEILKGRKMILVIDNAKWHKKYIDSFVKQSSSKSDIVNELITHDVESITESHVNHNSIVSKTWTKKQLLRKKKIIHQNRFWKNH